MRRSALKIMKEDLSFHPLKIIMGRKNGEDKIEEEGEKKKKIRPKNYKIG